MVRKRLAYLSFLLMFLVSAAFPFSEAHNLPRVQFRIPSAQEHGGFPLRGLEINASGSQPEPSYDCETFYVQDSRDPAFEKEFRSQSFSLSRKDRLRVRKLIRLVASEMGANPHLLEMFAEHESNFNPYKLHLQGEDRRANLNARSRFWPNPLRGKRLSKVLSSTSVQSPRYWEAKQKLEEVGTYQQNPFWNHRIEYRHILSEENVKGKNYPEVRMKRWRTVWGHGYGLYGMNSVLFTRVWDPEAPPWILCAEQGMIATVVAIWTLRRTKKECEELSARNPEVYGTDGGNYYGVIRRFGRGHCGRSDLSESWGKFFRRYRGLINWEAPARLGTAWDEETSDRGELLRVLREKAQAQGLLKQPPKRRRPLALASN